MLKTKRLGLVLTPTEKKAVTQLAEMEGGLSQSALIRRLIRKEAQVRGVWPQASRQQQDCPPPDLGTHLGGPK